MVSPMKNILINHTQLKFNEKLFNQSFLEINNTLMNENKFILNISKNAFRFKENRLIAYNKKGLLIKLYINLYNILHY